MGLVNRLLGNKKHAPPAPTPLRRDGVPLGLNQETPVLNITDEAAQRIRSILGSQEPPVHSLRVTSAVRGKYSMNLEPEGKPGLDDTVLPYDGFEIYVDAGSLKHLEGASLTWVDTYGGGGFQFTAPPVPQTPRPAPPEGEAGEIWRRIAQVLDEEVNPAVASHGGVISLIEYRDRTAYVEMGGGCQGCAMSKATLKQGVERILKEHFPEIEEVLDVTDHAGGRNPYYAA
jgi:Fe/S biogenesis protein NfuA